MYGLPMSSFGGHGNFLELNNGGTCTTLVKPSELDTLKYWIWLYVNYMCESDTLWRC